MIELLIYDLQHASTAQEASLAYHAILRMIQDEDSRIWYEQMYFKRIQQLESITSSNCSDKDESL